MNCMLDSLFPDIFIKSVYELPLAELKARGIRGLVFDIDNTIAPYDVAEPDESTVELFAKLRAEGFRLCILSNNKKKRVRLFNRNLKTLAFHRAGKPGVRKLKKAIARMGCTQRSAAMIGDQVFTDMLCGHCAGLLCIMTAPICNRDQLVTKVKRGLERRIMQIFWKRYPNGRKAN